MLINEDLITKLMICQCTADECKKLQRRADINCFQFQPNWRQLYK